MLGLDTSEGLVVFDLISSTEPINMFFQMDYLEDITLLSKLRKHNLPPVWYGLFTLLFKSLLERVAGSDSVSKLFFTILYGLYKDINLDYGSIL